MTSAASVLDTTAIGKVQCPRVLEQIPARKGLRKQGKVAKGEERVWMGGLKSLDTVYQIEEPGYWGPRWLISAQAASITNSRRYTHQLHTDNMTISTLTLNDGNQVPWIAFGTGTSLRQQDVQNPVENAIANGFTHLDGAQMYENEESLGIAIRASRTPRSELFVTTKLDRLQADQTAKTALQVSLKKLGLEYVDLYLVHVPGHHAGRLKEVWKMMEECKRERLAKSIGVSNFEVAHLQEILEGAEFLPSVNQIEIHPYVWNSLQPVMALHKEHGIITSSYGGLSPLFRAPGGPLDPVIEKIRARLESTRGQPVSISQVLNKWLQQYGILVVTTSSKADRMREYLDTPKVPELTAGEIQSIENAGAQRYHKFLVLSD